MNISLPTVGLLIISNSVMAYCWNYLAAAACILGAVYFIFRPTAG